jgi:hypothetical protein
VLAHFDFSSVPAALVTLVSLWWAIEGLGLLALGHLLPIDSPAAIRNYALSNILALVVGVFLCLAGAFGHVSFAPSGAVP